MATTYQWTGSGYTKTNQTTHNKKTYNKSYDSYDKSHSNYYGWDDWFYSSESLSSEKYITVKSHEAYITPNRAEIEVKYKNMFNQSFKGTIFDVEKIQEISRFLYYRMQDDKNYMKDVSEISYGETYLKNKLEFYESLWEKHIPGTSPLEMSLNFYGISKGPETTAGKYYTREQIESMSEKQDDDELDYFNKHSEDFWDPELSDLFDANFKNKKLDILSKISLLKELGAKFEVSKEINERIVSNSNLFKKKILRDYSQIHMVDHYQRIMPNYYIKLALKDITINAPIDIKENKQKIIILLDFSGSMSTSDKQDWVITILADRLRYVLRDQAEIFFSYYCYNPEALHFYHLHDRESVMKFWSSFSTSPNGGDTNIGGMVNKIKTSIEDDNKLCNLDVNLKNEKPEILVIHDGQDSVKSDAFLYKTNAITMLDGVNENLKDACVDTDGMYVYIPNGTINVTNPITSYEKGITRKLTV